MDKSSWRDICTKTSHIYFKVFHGSWVKLLGQSFLILIGCEFVDVLTVQSVACFLDILANPSAGGGFRGTTGGTKINANCLDNVKKAPPSGQS